MNKQNVNHKINDLRTERQLKTGLENEDYYTTKEGYMVFTEKYHLKRGYCCGLKCRHCPYEHKNVKK